MKHCTGLYNYKGFTFSFSEIYQDWTIEPSFLFKAFSKDDDSILDEFITGDGREYIQPLDTIKEIKNAITEFLNDNGKEKIIKDYIVFRDNK